MSCSPRRWAEHARSTYCVCNAQETLKLQSLNLEKSDSAEEFLQIELLVDKFPCLPSGGRLWFNGECPSRIANHEMCFLSISIPHPTLTTLLLLFALLRSDISLLGRGSLVQFSSVLSLDFLLT